MADFCFVVPVYKVPKDYLNRCIDSIIGQTHRDIELILVDDGSPDNCGEICDARAKEDNRIKVIHKKNDGLSEARNSGTKACCSRWISYVDGDDWVDKDFVESFLKRISTSNSLSDIYIYSGYRNYSHNEVVCTPYFRDGTMFTTYEERETLQKECCMVPTRNNGEQLFIGSGWAKVFSIDYIRKNEMYFTKMPYGEDSIFFLYSVELAESIEYVAKSVYHYRDTEGGMVNGFRKNADKEQDIYVEKLFEFAERYKKDESFIDVLYLRVFIAMQRCITQKFFNSGNPDSYLKRWSDCCRFFRNKPYCDLYKHLKFKELNRNSKIKYILFKTQMYGAMNYTRNKYNSARGKVMCEKK